MFAYGFAKLIEFQTINGKKSLNVHAKTCAQSGREAAHCIDLKTKELHLKKHTQ
jgi:hypothetical protein